MSIIYIILSSAAVSGFVTLLTGQFFEHRKYLQNKKLELYLDFLENVDKLFSLEGEDIKSRDTFKDKMIIASSDLHKINWKIRLVTKNNLVRENTENLVRTYDSLIDEFSVDFGDVDSRKEKSLKTVKSINRYREEFIKAANQEINSFLLK